MKKLGVLIAVCVLGLALGACSGENKTQNAGKTATSSTSALPSKQETTTSPTKDTASAKPTESKGSITKDEALDIAKEKMKGKSDIVYKVASEETVKGEEGKPPAGDYFIIVGQMQNEDNWIDLDGMIYVNKATGDTYFSGDAVEKLN